MTAACEFCGETVTPASRLAEYHVCRDCLKNCVQVAKRTAADHEETN
jgi:ribosome-binding protein aMBF1 (putative translation factor)